jgi:hypothetical protein
MTDVEAFDAQDGLGELQGLLEGGEANLLLRTGLIAGRIAKRAFWSAISIQAFWARVLAS